MAVVDYFLKIDGIPGDSHDSQHKGEIDVESWNWGETNVGDAAHRGGMGAGKVSMQDFHFTMRVGKGTPLLMQACATGEHIRKAVLSVRKAGKQQQEFLTITLSDFLVSSYQTGGSNHDGAVPVDQISLQFAMVDFVYREQKADGTLGPPIRTGYDVKANKRF